MGPLIAGLVVIVGVVFASGLLRSLNVFLWMRRLRNELGVPISALTPEIHLPARVILGFSPLGIWLAGLLVTGLALVGVATALHASPILIQAAGIIVAAPVGVGAILLARAILPSAGPKTLPTRRAAVAAIDQALLVPGTNERLSQDRRVWRALHLIGTLQSEREPDDDARNRQVDEIEAALTRYLSEAPLGASYRRVAKGELAELWTYRRPPRPGTTR